MVRINTAPVRGHELHAGSVTTIRAGVFTWLWTQNKALRGCTVGNSQETVAVAASEGASLVVQPSSEFWPWRTDTNWCSEAAARERVNQNIQRRKVIER